MIGYLHQEGSLDHRGCLGITGTLQVNGILYYDGTLLLFGCLAFHGTLAIEGFLVQGGTLFFCGVSTRSVHSACTGNFYEKVHYHSEVDSVCKIHCCFQVNYEGMVNLRSKSA